MIQKSILIISDNVYLIEKIFEIVSSYEYNDFNFNFCCSFSSVNLFNSHSKLKNIVSPIDVNDNTKQICDKFETIISIHCKQIFPPFMVESSRCINVHPGFNPYNRGWYPQVFAINNHHPHGVTIHEIDNKIDHGDIIIQKRIPIFPEDTSQSVYIRALDMEVELLNEHLLNIIVNNYVKKKPFKVGNYNSISDFNEFRKLNLDEKGTLRYFLDKLRSMTHGDYKNAYFIDQVNGDKIFVTVNLERFKKDNN